MLVSMVPNTVTPLWLLWPDCVGVVPEQAVSAAVSKAAAANEIQVRIYLSSTPDSVFGTITPMVTPRKIPRVGTVELRYFRV